MALRVLLGDDAFGFRLALKLALEDAGADSVTVCERWADVPAVAAAEQPDAILVDLLMPTFDADALVRTRAAAPGAVLGVISSYSEEDMRAQLDNVEGVDVILSKRARPADIARELLDRVTPPAA